MKRQPYLHLAKKKRNEKTDRLALIALRLHHLYCPSRPGTGDRQSDGTKDERRAADGLKFRLSEGVEGAEKREKQQLPSTDPLSDSDAKSLLKRIPEIKPTADDQTDFAKRIGSLPAPKTGNKIPVKFPSDEMRPRQMLTRANRR